MRTKIPSKHIHQRFTIGLALALLISSLSSRLTQAAPLYQEEDPIHPLDVKDCGECHLDILNNWSNSPHAHAYDDPVFQERWQGMGTPGDCLVCHTTNYQASTGEYASEGVYCQACHGKLVETHPPEVIPIRADTDYCGICHTTTLSEWRLTGHGIADVGCMNCHDPHSQNALFEVADEMCLNCHEEEMGDYLNDLHIQKEIGCVDCHSLVIPPDPIPDDGIVPTGHTFTVTPTTCVACHTDTLHAGFSLPGYEDGAKAIQVEILEDASEITAVETTTDEKTLEREQLQVPEQRIQILEAALASQNMTALFQGGVIGLVLGGSTAWIVARNMSRTPEENSPENDDDEEG